MSRIIACIRAYNEQERIEKCCQAYQFCDKILIADGSSTDATVKIAMEQPKTVVRDYPVKVQCRNGIWRNPDGPHLNFLWDWARDEGADWIISQDCDQRPNLYLKQQPSIVFHTFYSKSLFYYSIALFFSKEFLFQFQLHNISLLT